MRCFDLGRGFGLVRAAAVWSSVSVDDDLGEILCVGRGPSAAEQIKLDSLRKLYDVGMDCDDPLRHPLEACGRAAEEAKDDDLKGRRVMGVKIL